MHDTTLNFFDLLIDADAVSDVPARVYDRMMRDIQILADRLGASSDARRLVAWLDGDRQRYGDLIDVALSTAETASLTSFRRDGEEWRMEIVEEHTADGCALTAAMHHLRALLLARTYLQSSIYRATTIPADLKQALAILVLSLDAAPAHLQPALAITAGLGRTGDGLLMPKRLKRSASKPRPRRSPPQMKRLRRQRQKQSKPRPQRRQPRTKRPRKPRPRPTRTPSKSSGELRRGR